MKGEGADVWEAQTQEKPVEHPVEAEPIEMRKEFTSLFFDFPMRRGKHRNFSLFERLLNRNHIIDCGSLRVCHVPPPVCFLASPC
jgi:hypothetical protein